MAALPKKKTKKKTPLGCAFGQALKTFRLQSRQSQEALALACGVDRTYVSMLERGISQPTLGTVFLLSKELKVKPEALVEQTRKLLTAVNGAEQKKGAGRRTRKS